jgi:hypothetical protein
MYIVEICYATVGECGHICIQNLSKKLRLICNTVKETNDKNISTFPNLAVNRELVSSGMDVSGLNKVL